MRSWWSRLFLFGVDRTRRNCRELDRSAEVQDEGDDLVDRTGFELLDTRVVGGARGLLDVVFNGQHYRLENQAQRTDHENNRCDPTVLAEQAVQQRLQWTAIKDQARIGRAVCPRG